MEYKSILRRNSFEVIEIVGAVAAVAAGVEERVIFSVSFASQESDDVIERRR